MRRFMFTTLFAVTILFTGCEKEQKPIVLGAIYNLSGEQSSLDIASSQGAQLAVDEANKEVGLMARKVKLEIEDGETDTTVIVARIQQMLGKHPEIAALMGLSDTDMVLAAARIAAQHQRLFLTSGATSPQLPAQIPDYLFLACFGDNVQAAAAAEWAYRDLSAQTVSVIYKSTDTYTQLLQHYFQERFTSLGGLVLSVESYTSMEDIGPAIESIQNADLVFLAAWPDEAPQAEDLLRKAGFTAPIIGGDSFDSQDLWQQYPDADNVFFTTHAYLGADNPNPTVKSFRKKYIQAYPESRPDAFAALGYDTARLLIAAVKKADSTHPAEVLKALEKIQQFKGVTGTISYINGARIPTKSVSIIGIEKGNFKLVKELLPVEVPAPN